MKTLLIDSNGVGFQAACSLRGTEDEDIVQGTKFRFMKSILSYAKQFHSNRFVFCWDSRKNLRKFHYEGYKVKRNDDPEIRHIKKLCHPVFKLLRLDILPRCGFQNVFMQTGYESDDLIAQIVLDNEMRVTPKQLIIVSGDEDLFQLLTPNCSMYIPRKKLLYTVEDFEHDYGIPPSQWGTVKAIAGCKSDDVPGINGVGEQSVLKYLRGELNKSSSYYKKIQCKEGAETEEFFRKIVVLPMDGTKKIKLVKDKLDFHEFIRVCREYNFYSFRQNKDQWKAYIFNVKKKKIQDDLL